MLDFQKSIWENFGNDVIPYMPTHTISSGMMVWIVVIMLAFVGAVSYAYVTTGAESYKEEYNALVLSLIHI